MCWFKRRPKTCCVVDTSSGKAIQVEEEENYYVKKARLNAESNKRADKEHEANLYADQDEETLSRSWQPIVKIHPTVLGAMIEYEGTEFNAAYTTEISVSPGKPPNRQPASGGGYYAVGPYPSVITIISVAGNEKYIRISRHKADALFAAIMKEWKQYR